MAIRNPLGSSASFALKPSLIVSFSSAASQPSEDLSFVTSRRMFFPFYQDRTVVGKSTTSKLIKIKEPPPPALKTSFHLFSAELSVLSLSLSDTLRITLERVGECLECLEIYFSHTFQETSLGSSVRSKHRQGVFSLAGFLKHKICHHRIGIRPSSPLNTEQRTTTQDGL